MQTCTFWGNSRRKESSEEEIAEATGNAINALENLLDLVDNRYFLGADRQVQDVKENMKRLEREIVINYMSSMEKHGYMPLDLK